MPKTSRRTATQSKTDTTADNFFTCQCCYPVQNLFPREDLGGLTTDGQHAKIALCIFHKPVQVYVWNDEESTYERREDLKFENNAVVDDEGHQPFLVDQGVPSLVDLETDDETPEPPPIEPTDGGSQPASRQYVNLDDDEYY